MFRRLVALLFVFIMVSNEFVMVAKADPAFDESFYSNNDILFYDPRCDTGIAQGIISLQGKDNLEKILKFLMDPARGLTLAQASGIVGNFMAESHLDPSIIQGGGHANPDYKPVSGVGFGLAQWTFPARQQPLVNYINAHVPTKDITDLDGQVNFMWSELTGTHSNALRKLKETTTPLDAAISFHTYYEGSADSAAQVQQVRGANAQKIYDQYKDAPAIAGSTVSENTSTNPLKTEANEQTTGRKSCTPTAAGGDLIGLVQQYAWPEYRGLDITPTDAYRDAVDRAVAAKRYVGGIRHRGIDCGGFVTTLIIDSGYDKNYNYGSLTSQGAGYTVKQEAWLKANWKTLDGRDASDRQPGDVAINGTHTYIYVGPDAFPNGKPIASASLDERAPMQGNEMVINMPKHTEFRWYRKP